MRPGSDVFLKEDVSHILAALLLTNETAAAALTAATGADAAPYTTPFRQGYAAAIAAVGVALGIDVRGLSVRQLYR